MDNASALPTVAIDYSALAEQLRLAPPGQLYDLMVNAPFEQKLGMALLFLGFTCLYIVDEADGGLWLKAASDTEYYHRSIEKFTFDPKHYRLDFATNKDNDLIVAVATNSIRTTDTWTTVNSGKTRAETVSLNQASSGIAYTAIYPLQGSIRGALMFNYFQYPAQLGAEQQMFMERYTQLVSERLTKQ